MGAQLRVYKQKISTAQTTKKITKAMELIAASRIQKAMARVRASAPFARAVTRDIGHANRIAQVGVQILLRHIRNALGRARRRLASIGAVQRVSQQLERGVVADRAVGPSAPAEMAE